jgi:hypothetical protein
MPKYRPFWLGQAYPSVLTRLGAPRRLLTSRHGRTGAGAGPPADAGVEASRQAEQASGVRGESRRWSVVRLAPPREEEDRRGNQESAPKQRQTEEETDHKQDHEHMKDQTKPRCLKWGEEKAP